MADKVVHRRSLSERLKELSLALNESKVQDHSAKFKPFSKSKWVHTDGHWKKVDIILNQNHPSAKNVEFIALKYRNKIEEKSAWSKGPFLIDQTPQQTLFSHRRNEAYATVNHHENEVWESCYDIADMKPVFKGALEVRHVTDPPPLEAKKTSIATLLSNSHISFNDHKDQQKSFPVSEEWEDFTTEINSFCNLNGHRGEVFPLDQSEPTIEKESGHYQTAGGFDDLLEAEDDEANGDQIDDSLEYKWQHKRRNNSLENLETDAHQSKTVDDSNDGSFEGPEEEEDRQSGGSTLLDQNVAVDHGMSWINMYEYNRRQSILQSFRPDESILGISVFNTWDNYRGVILPTTCFLETPIIEFSEQSSFDNTFVDELDVNQSHAKDDSRGQSSHVSEFGEDVQSSKDFAKITLSEELGKGLLFAPDEFLVQKNEKFKIVDHSSLQHQSQACYHSSRQSSPYYFDSLDVHLFNPMEDKDSIASITMMPSNVLGVMNRSSFFDDADNDLNSVIEELIESKSSDNRETNIEEADQSNSNCLEEKVVTLSKEEDNIDQDRLNLCETLNAPNASNGDLEPSDKKENDYFSALPEDKINWNLNKLIEAIELEKNIILEAKNRLTKVKTTIEFAEEKRKILLSSRKIKIMKDDIFKLNSGLSSYPTYCEYEDLAIADITIPLRRNSALLNQNKGDFKQYLVCIFTCDGNVEASSLVPIFFQHNQETVIVPGIIHFTAVAKEAILLCEIYYILVSRGRSSHGAFLTIGKKIKRLLSATRKKDSFKLTRSNCFQLCYFGEFRPPRRSFTTLKMPLNSIVAEPICASISSSNRVLHNHHEGYLNVLYVKSGTVLWLRAWCVLTTNTLFFWENSVLEKTALPKISLCDISSNQIGPVCRDLCARPNTFLLETTRPRQRDDRNSRVLELDGEVARTKHLLSADTIEDRNEWCRKVTEACILLCMREDAY